jgi:Tol biopolymer transport system component
VVEVPFPSLGQIFNPTWSPDGRAIAFSALVGGWTDLYLYNLVDGDLRRLTNDAYADLQPAWSPDGRSLAFVTDRFTTDLATLQPGSYRLALLTVSSEPSARSPRLMERSTSTRNGARTGAVCISCRIGAASATFTGSTSPRAPPPR